VNTSSLFKLGTTVKSKQTRLFLGDDVTNRNIQTYHDPKYPFLLEAAEELRALGNWSKNEIDLSKEKTSMDSLTEAGRHVFESGLKFAIALDSCAGRGPLQLFNDYGISNNPEWELYLTNHQNNELLHSESYTEMVRAIFNDVDNFIDSIIQDEEVQARAESILSYFDKATAVLDKRMVNDLVPGTYPDIDDHEVRKAIYRSALTLNMFEGIRFFSTFATAWSFSEQPEKLFSGSGNVFKLIARDEMIHLDVFQKVIRMLRTDESEGFVEVAQELEEETYDMFTTAFREEMLWIDHLFSKGTPLIGMNDQILKEYIEFIFCVRMENIGLDYSKIGLVKHNNPLPWMDNYLDSSHIKAAPQEIESVNYVAAIDSSKDEDIDLDDL